MRIRSLMLTFAGVIGLGLAGLVAWYLASPLFINQTVDEAFPFDLPDQTELAAMSEGELKVMEEKLMAALPAEADMAKLSTGQQAQVVDKVMAAAAAIMADKMMAEAMPEAASGEWMVAGTGQFVDADSFHRGSGKVTIFQQGDNRVLRLEEFMVTNGPDLHVLLAANPAPTGHADLGEYLDLGSLKGNIGNQNYEIPAGTDLSQYRGVVIYCMPFHVVFATAALN
jgi:hypothetical protein